MSFDRAGFLDPNSQIPTEQHARYGDLFELAYAFSNLGMQIAQTLPMAKSNRELVSAGLFARSIAHFQAAVLLIAHGTPVEAMILTRSLVETSFVIGALANEGITPGELASHDLASRRKMANALVMSTTLDLGEHRDRLKKFAKEHEETRKKDIHVDDMARLAGLSDLYNGFYRHLSHNAAHPSISAMELYFVEGNGEEDHISFRCVPEDTPKALLLTCIAMLVIYGSYEPVGGTTPQLNKSISDLGERYASLERLYPIWDRSGDARESAQE